MRKLTISILIISVFFSCKSEGDHDKHEDNKMETTDENIDSEEEDMIPLSNMYGEDSVDTEGNLVYGDLDEKNFEVNKEVVPQVDSVSGREYTLGPVTDIPLSNIYGEDSIGPDGNFVYPHRDTIWSDKK